jgi:hypothetical protein
MNPSKGLVIVGRLSIVYASIMFVLLFQALLYLPFIGVFISYGLYSMLLIGGFGTLKLYRWSWWIIILFAGLIILASFYNILVAPFVIQEIFGAESPCGSAIISACNVSSFVEGALATLLLWYYSRPVIRLQFSK